MLAHFWTYGFLRLEGTSLCLCHPLLFDWWQLIQSRVFNGFSSEHAPHRQGRSVTFWLANVSDRLFFFFCQFTVRKFCGIFWATSNNDQSFCGGKKLLYLFDQERRHFQKTPELVGGSVPNRPLYPTNWKEFWKLLRFCVLCQTCQIQFNLMNLKVHLLGRKEKTSNLGCLEKKWFRSSVAPGVGTRSDISLKFQANLLERRNAGVCVAKSPWAGNGVCFELKTKLRGYRCVWGGGHNNAFGSANRKHTYSILSASQSTCRKLSNDMGMFPLSKMPCKTTNNNTGLHGRHKNTKRRLRFWEEGRQQNASQEKKSKTLPCLQVRLQSNSPLF